MSSMNGGRVCLEKLGLLGPGFRTLGRDFVRGVCSDKRSPPAPVRELQGERWVVPEGLNDRSQAIYCLEQVQSKIRPVGHGLILTPGLTDRLGHWHAYRTQS
jgi:hypothetical protein